jgi:short-subunit dehydrogenase
MLAGKRILLTGAAGGLGHALAEGLAIKGAKLALVDKNAEGLHHLCTKIAQLGGSAHPIVNDFTSENAIQTVVNEATQQLGAIDILINSAGILDFTYFEAQNPARIQQIMAVNSILPMQLTRAVLPSFSAKNAGHIVNIGSIFGSIGFPHYAVYSASKFALRGFSQALSRELIDTDIKVSYIAPRAIKTPINNEASAQMMAATNTAMDEPIAVARQIIEAIEKQKQTHYIGQPESLFAWLNGFLPCVVSMGLTKPTKIARQFLNKTSSPN